MQSLWLNKNSKYNDSIEGQKTINLDNNDSKERFHCHYQTKKKSLKSKFAYNEFW